MLQPLNEGLKGPFISPYNCLRRLNDRFEFEDTFRLHHKTNAKVYDNTDLFAVADAVIKRGGFQEVSRTNRWPEIVESLRHYNYTAESLNKIFEDHLVDYQNRLRRDGTLENKAVFRKPRIQKFVNPPRYLKGHLEHLFKNKLFKAEEDLMRDLRIQFADQYLSLRGLALSGRFEMTKLHKSYLLKYVAVCKFMIASSAMPFSFVDANLLKFLKLGVPHTSGKKVLIVGGSLINLILAYKLSLFGFVVTILERPNATKAEADIEQMNPVLFDLGKRDPLYCQLISMGFLFDEMVEKNVRVFDSKFEQYSAEQVKAAEIKLYAILSDIVFTAVSATSSSLLKRELQEKANSLNPRQKALVMLHFSRMMMTTKLLGDHTEVRTFKRHCSLNNMQDLMAEQSLMLLRKDLKKFRDLFGRLPVPIKFEQKQTFTVEIRENQVNVHVANKIKPVSYDYLVYGLVDNISEAVRSKNYKMPQFTGQYLLQSLYVLGVLKSQIYIHNILYFSDRSRLGNNFESMWVNSKLLGDVYLKFNPEQFENYGHGTILAIYRKPGDRADEKKELNQLIGIIQKIFGVQIKQGKLLKGTQRIESSEFFLRQSAMQRQKSLLQPRTRLYLTLPLMCVKYNGKLVSMLANVDFILHSIISNCSLASNSSYIKMLQEHDMEVYEEQQAAETVITRKPVDAPTNSPSKQGLNFQVVPQKPRSQQMIVIEKPQPVQAPPPPLPEPESQAMHIQPQLTLSPELHPAPLPPIPQPIMIQPQLPVPPSQSPPPPPPPPPTTPQALFCLDSIASHLKYVQSQIDMNGIKVALQSVYQWQLTSPVKIDKTRYIFQMGVPFAHQHNLSCLAREDRENDCQTVKVLDGFVSRRIDRSIFKPQKLTYYYQTALVVKGHQQMYAMIDQNAPAMVFYHTDLGILVGAVRSRIEQICKIKDIPLTMTGLQKLPAPTDMNCLFPSMIKRVIEVQLSQQPDVDQALSKKLRFQNFNFEQRPLYYASKLDNFLRALHEILEQQSFIRGYKQLNILQMITGEYDPRVLLLRRFKKGWQGQPEKFDTKMFQSLIKLKNMTDNTKDNQKFTIEFLEYSQHDYKVKRKFLSLNEPAHVEPFIFSKQRKPKQIFINKIRKAYMQQQMQTFYYIGESISKTQFENPSACLHNIITRLIDHFQINFLIKYFRQMFIHQLNKNNKLDNRLKMLMKMQLAAKPLLSKAQQVTLNQHFEESKTSTEQRQQFKKAIVNGSLDIIDGIFFHSF